MDEYRTVREAVDTIVRALNTHSASEKKQEELREDFRDLWDDLQPFRDPDAFVNHVTGYIESEYDRKHPDTGEPKREKSLCGCASPTCWLKRGELPAAIQTSEQSFLQTKTTTDAVSEVLQSHTRPHVLREAVDEWDAKKHGPLRELVDLQARAKFLLAPSRN